MPDIFDVYRDAIIAVLKTETIGTMAALLATKSIIEKAEIEHALIMAATKALVESETGV